MAKSQRSSSRSSGHVPPPPVDPEDNDAALIAPPRAPRERQPGTYSRALTPEELKAAEYDPKLDDGENDEGPPEDFPEDVDGYGPAHDDPEDGPELPDPRGTPVDFSRGASRMSMGTYGAGSDQTDGKLDPIARKLRSLGPQIVLRFQRLKPTDVPDSELGWSPWITLPTMSPNYDDVEEFVTQRAGGGTFEVQLRSAVDRSRFLPDPIRVIRSGQWRPTTPDGAEYYRSRYGSEWPMDGSNGSSAPPASGGGEGGQGGALGAATQILSETMRLAQRTVERKENNESAKAVAESNTLVGIVSALGGNRQPMDVVALGGLALTYMQHQATIRLEADKLQFQREQAAREAAAKDREFMFAMLAKKDGGPTDAAALAAIEIVKAAAAGESGLKLEFMRGMMKQALSQAGIDTDDGEKETISSMLVDLLKDGVKNLPQILTALKAGRPPAEQQLPPGYLRLQDGRIVTTEQYQALAAAAQQRHLAAGPARRGLPPPPPPPPTAAPPAPAPTAPGSEVAQPMPGTLPPPELAPPLPLPPAPMPAPPPPPEVLRDGVTPIEGLPPLPPEVAGAPEAGPTQAPLLEGPGSGVPPEPDGGAPDAPDAPPQDVPVEDESLVVLHTFLSIVAKYTAKKQNYRYRPDRLWAQEVPGEGEYAGLDMDAAFEECPESFRDAMEAWEKGNPLSFTTWTRDLGVPQISDVARRIDEALLQDATAVSWVEKFLEHGPWTEDDDGAP